jgi:hypothetical protein
MPSNTLQTSFLFIMPCLSKRAIFIRGLGDAVVSHHISCDVHKLICEESESDTDDDEILGSKEVAVIHYATMHSLHYLFRDNCYRPDKRGRRSGNDICSEEKWQSSAL